MVIELLRFLSLWIKPLVQNIKYVCSDHTGEGMVLLEAMSGAIERNFAENDNGCDLSGTGASQKIVVLAPKLGLGVLMEDVGGVPPAGR